MDYSELKNNLLNCRICEELFGYEPRPVVQGQVDSKIMQISQAPSLRVHKTGRPFDDASGKTLREEWYQILDETFYDPDIFYITSVGHCFPGKSPNGGDKAPPKICAKTWLRKEMDYVNNEIYLIVGSYAASFFFPKESLTSLVFQDKEINGKPVFILPHPSPLNKKWLKDNPDFLNIRMKKVRTTIHNIIDRTGTET